jgi:hypothetical protein
MTAFSVRKYESKHSLIHEFLFLWRIRTDEPSIFIDDTASFSE